MFTTGESRLDLPVKMLLGQKTRKQLGARGDGHSSCHCSLASLCGLWGSVASSMVNNTDIYREAGATNRLKIAPVLYEKIMNFYFSGEESLVAGALWARVLIKFDLYCHEKKGAILQRLHTSGKLIF